MTLGTKQSRTVGLNWDELNYPMFNLEAPITDGEIKSAVFAMPKENVPPDGFIGAFYSKCWETVKGDAIIAILQISQLREEAP
jgi:hypothetical protein